MLIVAVCVCWIVVVAYWLGYGHGRERGAITVTMRAFPAPMSARRGVRLTDWEGD